MNVPSSILVVHDWHTECGACGYGSGGWTKPPAGEILGPDSTTCPGCDVRFTHVQLGYGRPKPLDERSEAA